MRNRMAVIILMMFVLLLSSPLYATDHRGQESATDVDGAKGVDGVIGISLHVGAERIGDPALLYVGRVHREGPAYKAGLRHGDELVSVDGKPVAGKSYEEVVKMIRGDAGSTVQLQVKREGEEGPREIAVARVAGEQLMKVAPGHGTYKNKPQTQP